MSVRAGREALQARQPRPVRRTPQAAEASGGATAGKYTTIPIAKRRYFGRVRQGVYEFISMEAPIKAGDPKNAIITGFFSQSMLVKKEKKKANCVAAPGFLGGSDECVSAEKTSSRWEDLQLAMYLLGNAFRMDSGKPPEKVKQVKQAKLFFAEVEKLKKASAAGNAKEAALRYALAREALDVYLNDVELPPTFVPNEYVAPTDVTVRLCQGPYLRRSRLNNCCAHAQHMCIPAHRAASARLARPVVPSVMCRPTDALTPRRERPPRPPPPRRAAPCPTRSSTRRARRSRRGSS